MSTIPIITCPKCGHSNLRNKGSATGRTGSDLVIFICAGCNHRFRDIFTKDHKVYPR
jgi:transposase-like protein